MLRVLGPIVASRDCAKKQGNTPFASADDALHALSAAAQPSIEELDGSDEDTSESESWSESEDEYDSPADGRYGSNTSCGGTENEGEDPAEDDGAAKMTREVRKQLEKVVLERAVFSVFQGDADDIQCAVSVLQLERLWRCFRHYAIVWYSCSRIVYCVYANVGILCLGW